MFARILGVIFTFAFLLFTFSSPVFAQTPSQVSQSLTPIPSYIPPTSPVFTDLLVSNMFHTFSCLAIGQSVIGSPCLSYQITKNAQGLIQSTPVLSQVNLEGGALGAVTNVIGMLYENPPVRTADYLASVGQDLGIVKEAHAQVFGSGAAVLNPILTLWQVSRNISYVIMIIIFVIIGLMVMFRNKINPQTVITAQAALPGLVIGLIMITFSYFLAGLVSDTAFIGTNLVGYYFTSAQPELKSGIQTDFVGDLKDRNVLSIFAPFTRTMGVDKIVGILNTIWDSLGDSSTETSTLESIKAFVDPTHLDPQRVIRNLAMLLISQVALPIGSMSGGIGQVVAGAVTLVAGQVAGIQLVGFALTFVAIIILLYAMFKLLLRLVTAYLTIIFLTITAPFQFLFASLPGRQGAATEWILNMLGNVLAFPAVLAVLYFVAIMLGPSLTPYCDHPNAKPPQLCPFKTSQLNQVDNNTLALVPTTYASDQTIIGTKSFPLFGGLDLSFIQLLLAFGALVAMPTIPDIIIRAVGKASQAGQLIGQEIGASTGAGQRYAGQYQSGATGFTERVGNLRDQPLRYATAIKDAAGKEIGVEWKEAWEPRIGVGSPTQGTWSRLTNSSGWKNTLGRFRR